MSDDDYAASVDYAAERMAQDAFERREWDRGAGVLDPEPSNPWLPGGRFWPPDEETLRANS